MAADEENEEPSPVDPAELETRVALDGEPEAAADAAS